MEDTPSPLSPKAWGQLKNQKKEMLYDIYRKEADDFMHKHQYHKALESFNLAIELQPEEKRALIGRSRCYLLLGKTYRAMQDVEKVLSVDASDLDAVFQKAEILYLTGNHQLSSVYYKKGQKRDPDNQHFNDGVRKANAAIHTLSASSVCPPKLSAVGDLSFLLHSKRRSSTQTDFDEQDTGHNTASGREAELPSAGFRTRHQCPLIRISRKPRVPQLQSLGLEHSKVGELGGLQGIGEQEEGSKSTLRQPDEDTMKKILGELYGDRQYLQKLQTDLPFGRGRTRRDVRELATEGAEFLRERSALWGRDSLEHPDSAPLPPPPVPIATLKPSYSSRHCRRLSSVYKF